MSESKRAVIRTGAYDIPSFQKVQRNYSRSSKNVILLGQEGALSGPGVKMSRRSSDQACSLADTKPKVRDTTENRTQPPMVYFGQGRFYQEYRPVHSCAGVRIGEASNPGPPKNGKPKPVSDKKQHRQRHPQPKAVEKFRLCHNTKCCIKGHYHAKKRAGLNGAVKRLHEAGAREEKKEKSARKPEMRICKKEFGHQCKEAHCHSARQNITCLKERTLICLECDESSDDGDEELSDAPVIQRRRKDTSDSRPVNRQLVIQDIRQRFIEEPPPYAPPLPPRRQNIPEPEPEIPEVVDQPEEMVAPEPQEVLAPILPDPEPEEIEEVPHVPLQPQREIPTSKRLIYTNLMPTHGEWSNTWNYWFRSWFMDNKDFIIRNPSDLQFTDEVHYINPVIQNPISDSIENSWLRHFYKRTVHDLVDICGFAGCSEEDIYPEMLEQMRLDCNIARYSALNTDFTARPNARSAIARLVIANDQYRDFLRDCGRTFENTISYFHWTLLMKDYINLRRCVTPSKKLGNASPSVRIIHRNGGVRR